MQAILTIGISASGKSTWAKNYIIHSPEFIEINRDDLREYIFTHEMKKGEFQWGQWNMADEDLVTQKQHALIRHAAHNKKNIVISDTNINPYFRKQLVAMLTELKFVIIYKFFDISLEEAILRDKHRENPVGEEIITKQFLTWETQFSNQEAA